MHYYSVIGKARLDIFGASGKRLELQQKQVFVGSLDTISAFILDVLQIYVLLWSLFESITYQIRLVM